MTDWSKMQDISNMQRKIWKDGFKDMIRRYNEFVAKNKREPAKIQVYPPALIYITLGKFKEMKKRWDAYIKEKKAEPKFVWINMPADPNFDYYEVVYKVYEKQDTGYTCGPSSMVMMLGELAHKRVFDEWTLKNWAGTTTAGTGHDGIFYAAKVAAQKLGWKIKTYEKSLAEVTWKQLGEMIRNDKIGVIAHVVTQPLPFWDGEWWGHYVFPIAVNLKTKKIKIADPGRSVPMTYDATFDQFRRACELVTWAKSLLVIEKIF